jgi:hypothetical protein
MITTILDITVRELIKKIKLVSTNIETKLTNFDKKIKDNTLLILQLRKDLDVANEELRKINSRINTILPGGLQNLSQGQWDEYVDDDQCKRKHKKHHNKC